MAKSSREKLGKNAERWQSWLVMRSRHLFLAVVLLLLGSASSLRASVAGKAPVVSVLIAILDNSARSLQAAENPWLNSESRNGLLCHNDPVNKSDPMGLEVEIETRPLLGGIANHSWVKVVTEDNVKTTFSGTNNGKLGVERNYKADFEAKNVNSRQVIPPPEGMTQKQWDEKVLKEGEKQMKQDGKRDYKADAGDEGKTSGNCHVVTSDIIESAGGSIPKTYDPPGANPGLRTKDK